ncbi:prostaglandin E synthase 3-like isoform X4 [Convolutriloba macropyga]|uniref:prostaglandin E synthase 3-like isoform X4 n=1 Tax=Convolutriloba macropyga TaxID=536237 RepID=UPI003F51FE7A
MTRPRWTNFRNETNMVDQNQTLKMAAVPCMWAQSKDIVFITFEVTDTSKATVEAKENKLKFICTKKSGDEMTREIELFKDVIEDVKVRRSDRDVLCTLTKAPSDDDSFWPRLTKSKLKDKTIKVDFARWKESDDEEGDDFNFDNDMSDMMAGMGDGGLGGLGGMDGGLGGMDDDEEPDSDDEDDMPDLEDAAATEAAPPDTTTDASVSEEATPAAGTATEETTS